MSDTLEITHKEHRLVQLAQAVIQEEIEAIQALMARLDASFIKACQLFLHTKGRVIVMGIGKSGHIGRKIAATFASTGTPAFFIHPTEASHGDLGMITKEDIILAISNSGQTQELITLLPVIKRLNIPLVAMTGKASSPLAQYANVVLDISVSKEACPLGLAPTSSTTVTLVLGDALAVALLEARGFTKENFAQSHPGGKLGKHLLVRIQDVMRTGTTIPKIFPETTVRDALLESRVNLGLVAIVDTHNHLLGVFSDGDLRRTLDKNLPVQTTLVSAVMSTNCITVQPSQLAAEALTLMDTYRIHALLVVDAQDQLVGAFNIHDLFYHGVM
jgi:arabinose-5-phosphate isomerase